MPDGRRNAVVDLKVERRIRIPDYDYDYHAVFVVVDVITRRRTKAGSYRRADK